MALEITDATFDEVVLKSFGQHGADPVEW